MSGPKKTHVKFNDDDDISSNIISTNTDLDTNMNKNKKKKFYDSDSDSDNDAPEEEGMDEARADLEKRKKEQQLLIKEEQRLLKEKRRKQNMIFKEQQLEKKLKIEQQQKEKAQEKQGEEKGGLVELSKEFLQNINNNINLDKKSQPQIMNSINRSRHINFNDEEAHIESDNDDYMKNKKISQQKEKIIKEVNDQLTKKGKKKTLRNLRKKVAKKGPVTVEVLSSGIESKIMAPKKETEVMITKDRWLKRKSLNRK